MVSSDREAQAAGHRAGRLLLLLVMVLLLASCTTVPPTRAAQAGESVSVARPPLTPRWAYEPWAWEDEEHTSAALLDLVANYQARDVPIGVAIIDSPWETNYNTFQFGPNYPDPQGLIDQLHGRGVRVLLWTTGFVNVASNDGPERGKAATYDDAYAAGYFVDRGRTYEWDRGIGSAIDFFNPNAVAWWYEQMDRAFRLGVDGWKVDDAEGNLPLQVDTASGPKTRGEYRAAYYRAMYRYVAERNPDAIITARPYDGGTAYAPLDVNPAGWVGDQDPNWEGLEQALENILISAEQGYAVVGSDIGGFRAGERSDRLFMRWSQLGALSPLMENGGRGEHRPWQFDENVLRVYRYYAKLHRQLVPYLYSAGVEAHLTGQPIIRDPDRQGRQYLLGEDLLVAPIIEKGDERQVALPAVSRWHDYWNDDRVLIGPATVKAVAPRERAPLFIRAGTIIPMQVDDSETGHGGRGSSGHLTLLLYPDGESERTYYPDAERSVGFRSRREPGFVAIDIGPQSEHYVLRIKEPGAPDRVGLERGEIDSQPPPLSSWETFDTATEGWYYDAARGYLWVRFATAETGARLTYQTSQ